MKTENNAVTQGCAHQHHPIISRANLFALGFTLATLGMVSPAAAFESQGVMFIRNDRAAAPPNVPYAPATAFSFTDTNANAVFIIRHDTGKYQVNLGGNHDPLKPVISQVVAFGSDNVVCKLDDSSMPFFCNPAPGVSIPPNKIPICTAVFVACYTPLGGEADSQFELQVHAFPADGGLVTGFYGLFESTAKSHKSQMVWEQSIFGANGFLRSETQAVAVDSVSTSRPIPYYDGVGKYHVDFPDLASKPLGTAQVTAIGGDATRCKLANAPNAAASGSTTLRVEIRCFLQDQPWDSNFSLMYDSGLIRLDSKTSAARAYASNNGSSDYTPARSLNSGAIVNSPGTNRARRDSKGNYRMFHSSLQPTGSSAYLVSVGSSTGYCKIVSWGAAGDGTDVKVRCFDYQGNVADSNYQENYEGPQISPH